MRSQSLSKNGHRNTVKRKCAFLLKHLNNRQMSPIIDFWGNVPAVAKVYPLDVSVFEVVEVRERAASIGGEGQGGALGHARTVAAIYAR